jgi:stress response protein YsnF
VTAGSTVSDAAFTDKVIEMTETGEEAVVGKTARVVEEVALRKEAVDHVETVRDTVRKEEVEVENVAGDGLSTDRLNKPIPRS